MSFFEKLFNLTVCGLMLATILQGNRNHELRTYVNYDVKAKIERQTIDIFTENNKFNSGGDVNNK